MTIEYVCSSCAEKLDLSGPCAVNEAGRKFCSRCGSNRNPLFIIDAKEYFASIIKEIKK